MSHTDHRTLLDRGRKAGLNTRELYQALGARRPGPGDLASGLTDGNGFVVRVLADGHCSIKPTDEQRQ